jgi:predicted nucleic acid-binding protein
MRVLVDTLWWGLKPQDWIALGLIALVPALMVIAIYLIHREVRRAAQRIGTVPVGSETQPLRLKTTETQRQQWRMGKQRHPRAIVDLTDDVETLLRLVKAGRQS